MDPSLQTPPDFQRQTSGITAVEKPGFNSTYSSTYNPTYSSTYNTYSGGGTYNGAPTGTAGGDSSNQDLELNEKGTGKGKRPKPKKRKSAIRQKWDHAVEEGRWARVTYSLVGLLLLIIWLAVMLGFARAALYNEKKNSSLTRSNTTTPSDYVLQGTIVKFDTVERNLKINWALYIVGEDNQLLQTGTNSSNNLAIAIWQDMGVVPEDRIVTNTEGWNGVFRIDNTTQAPLGVIGKHPYDSVETQIDFGQKQPEEGKGPNVWIQPSFGYPFDVWTGSIVLIGSDIEFAQANNLTNSYVVGLIDAVLVDSTLNWKIGLSTKSECPDPAFIGCALTIDLTAKRPGLVQFAALIAVIVNWTSTIGIFFLTCEAVIMRRHYILRDTDILGVCLTALFALPSVRAILPGAPEFGALIDLVGIIPNVIIISICTTIFAVVKLRYRPEKEE